VATRDVKPCGERTGNANGLRRIMHIAIWIAASWAACALAEEPPIHFDNAENFGRLKRIVQPEYPPEAVSRGQAGVVDLVGVVRSDGFIKEFEFLPDKAESAIFVEALRPVVGDWIFVVPVGNDCQPSPKPITVRVSFEIDNGTPRIFVEHQPLRKTTGPTPTHYRPTKRINPRYPYDMLTRGIMADVYARIVVNRDGLVMEVSSKAYPPRQDDLSSFTTAAEKSLSKWEFPKVEDGYAAPWIGCYTISFRIRG
jgi:hypothetical protein